MKKARKSKGNWTYYLEFDEALAVFNFIALVKIRSKKKIAEIKSTKEKAVDLNFSSIDELENSGVSASQLGIINAMYEDLKNAE